jgi:hypothetical protein
MSFTDVTTFSVRRISPVLTGIMQHYAEAVIGPDSNKGRIGGNFSTILPMINCSLTATGIELKFSG